MIHLDKLAGRLGNRLFQLAYVFGKMKDGEADDIYVQDYKYFDNHRDSLRAFLGGDIYPIDQVAVHVRRGDYVGNPFYVDLTQTPYYVDAMAKFPEASFLVFSDDIEWCKKQEVFKGCDFSEGNTELEDLNLMAGCKGHIIANSSFSWWGAYISPFTTKVVAPKEWYADEVERTTCPPDWIRL